MCSDCAAGKILDDTTKACNECGRGKYRGGADDDSVCRECPEGYKNNVTASGSCLPCTPGEFQDLKSQETCKQCPKNTKSENANSVQCMGCDAGSKSNAGSAKCTKCDAGEAGTGENGACQSCQEGQYRNSSMSAAACFTCPAGYSSDAGSTKCQICEAGKFSGVVGDDCEDCAAGNFRTGSDEDATTCNQCPKGWHQPEDGQGSCLPCIPGTFNNELGQEECKDCAANKYSNITKQTSCKSCSIGETSVTGSASCQPCSAGEVGTPCTPCVGGKFRAGNDKDASTCDQCPRGWHQPDDGQGSCLPCIPVSLILLLSFFFCVFNAGLTFYLLVSHFIYFYIFSGLIF